MQKKIFVSSFVLAILTCVVFMVKLGSQRPVTYDLTVNAIDNMPLVEDDPFAAMAAGGTPIAQRDEAYRRWLSVSLKIQCSNCSGSGTIVSFNTEDGYAYVQSCGHLWANRGNMSAEEGKQRNITCKVITWYHNEKKLDSPREYTAEVLYFSNSKGRDVSLLRFKPDWTPNILPIAPEDFEFKKDMRLHSCGCDAGSEVAHYDVRYIGMRDNGGGSWLDFVTTENSPRPGRSGGGLMSDNYYVGICWGTTAVDGSGNGYFTPLSTLRQYNKQNGFGWINDVSQNWARMIPIRDRNNPQKTYPPDYIPLPQRSTNQ